MRAVQCYNDKVTFVSTRTPSLRPQGAEWALSAIASRQRVCAAACLSFLRVKIGLSQSGWDAGEQTRSAGAGVPDSSKCWSPGRMHRSLDLSCERALLDDEPSEGGGFD